MIMALQSPVPAELVGLTLYEKDAKLCSLWPGLILSWRIAYPGVDVVAEVRKAHAWEVANPQRAKVMRSRFLNNWLAKAQDAPRTTQRAPNVSNNIPTRNRALAARQEAPIDAVAMKKLLTQANLLRERQQEEPTPQEVALASRGLFSEAIEMIRARISCCSFAHAEEILRKAKVTSPHKITTPHKTISQQIDPEEYL